MTILINTDKIIYMELKVKEQSIYITFKHDRAITIKSFDEEILNEIFNRILDKEGKILLSYENVQLIKNR